MQKAYHSGESEADNSQTPWWLVRQLEQVVNVEFIHDVCAKENSAKAENYWTKEDDALSIPWHDAYTNTAGMPKHSDQNCALWMNPPFSMASQFTTKAADEANSGAVILGCCVHAPDRAWFQEMEKRATFIYVPDKRIQFLKHDGTPFTRKDPHTGKTVRSGANFPLCFPLWTPFNNGGEAKQVRFITEKEKYS